MNLHTFAQLTVNGLINGSTYGLLGAGFALILGVTGRFHFAFALTYTVAAYIASVLASGTGVPAGLAIVIGLAAGTAVGLLVERLVYRPVAGRAGPNALLAVFVVSLMLTIVGEATVNLIWGITSQNRQLTLFDVQTLTVSDLTFTNLDVVIVAASWLSIGLMVAFLRGASVGRKVRAVRSNPLMAEAVGISAGRVFLVVFGIGSLVSGIAGVLYALKFAAVPDMGERPVFYAFVVAFLGGTRRSPLVVGVAGLALGLVESWSAEWLSAQWSSLVVFGVLFLYVTRRSIATDSGQRLLARRTRTRADARAEA